MKRARLGWLAISNHLPACLYLSVILILLVSVSTSHDYTAFSHGLIIMALIVIPQIVVCQGFYELIRTTTPDHTKKSLSVLLLYLAVIQLILYFCLPDVVHYLAARTSYDLLNYWQLKTNLGLVAIVMLIVWQYDKSLENQESQSTAVIQALQARIRPHFLFNSMNTLADLIPKDTALAETLVVDMADLFRSSLRTNTVLVPIAEELELCKKYSQIEKLRLGERVHFAWHIPEHLVGTVPLFSLQPIIENAVYHGIQPLRDGGTVCVRLTQNKQTTTICVSNPVGDANALKRHQGHCIGQKNIQQRLLALYGNRATFMTDCQAGRYQVTLQIPLKSVVSNENIVS